MRFPRFLLLLVVIVAALITPAARAALNEQKTLIVRGRATDADGFPLARARVLTLERQLSALSDADGRFSLSIPLGSSGDLIKQHLQITLRAERKGWRLSAPGGETLVRLELQVAPGSDGLYRCVARSNSVEMAGAAARLMAADGEASAVASVNFLGVAGDPGPAQAPKSLHSAQAALVGVDPAPSPKPTPPPLPPTAPQPAAPSIQSGADAGRGPGETVVVSPSEIPPPAPATSTRSTARSSKSSSSSVPKSAGAATGSAAAAAAREREAREKARATMAGGTGRAPAPAAVDTGLVAMVPSLTEARLEAERAIDATRSRSASKKAARSSGSNSAAGRTGATDAAGANRPGQIVIQVDESPAPAVQPEPGPARATEGGPRIIPPPAGESRTRTAPLLIRGRGTPKSAPDSCACLIQGTIEVRTHRPLKRRVRIAVAVEGEPQSTDTVELFMGSPRQFTLPAVACGTHKLTVRATSEVSVLEVLTPEQLGPFTCDGRRIHQTRLVIVVD